MLGWSYSDGKQARVRRREEGNPLVKEDHTYEDFQDVDLVDECCVVLHLLFLNSLDSKFLFAFSMLGQVDDTEAAIRELLLERVDLLDVALSRVDEVLLMIRGVHAACSACTAGAS